MLLAEGQFNSVGTYNIKFAEKYGDRDQFLKDVTIHLKGNDGRTNATVIKSKTGELASDEDSNVLKLILSDGHYYSDFLPKDRKARNRKPFAKSTFETKIINIDLSKINNVDFDEQSQTNKYNMLDVGGLNKTIDSLVIKYNNEHETFSKTLQLRSGLNKKQLAYKTATDSSYTGPVLELFNTKRRIEMVDLTLKSMTSSKQLIVSKDNTMKNSRAWLNRHVISLHEKFALGFACVILFFVGAPLGALIRKGGLGLPMVIAILLFLTYHFIGIFATNSAKNGGFNPIIAPWFSTLVMFPLGFFLTKRATADRGLFEFGNVLEPLKKALKIKEKNSIDYKFLLDHENGELLDVINNYDTLGHQEDIRYHAIELLNSRGVQTDELRKNGLHISETYDTSEAIKKNYNEHSKFAIVLYTISLILLVLFFVLKNNKLLSVATPSIQLSSVALVLFIIYYIKSIINMFQFYNHINKNHKKPNILRLIIGLPFYFISHIFLNEKMKGDLKVNCLESLK